MARPRKPTNLKILQGTYRADQENPLEPMPEAAAPEAPESLKGEARAEWDRVVPQMVACGMLTHLDRGVLMAYCNTWARYVKAEEHLETEGEMKRVSATSTFESRNEWLNISFKLVEQLHKLSVELGLSAPSRSRIKVRPSEAKTTGWSKFGT